MYVYIVFVSVKWPALGKDLLSWFTSVLSVSRLFVISVISRFGFRYWCLYVIGTVPGHCLHFTLVK